MQPNITTTEPRGLQPKHHIFRIILIALFVVIIAVATIFIVRNIQHTNLENDVKSELMKQNKAIKAAAVNNVYKQTLPPSVASTDKVNINAVVSVTGVSYCISATSKLDGKVAYHMNENTPEDSPLSGDCDSDNATTTASLPGDVAIASTGTTDVTLGWSASLYATGYIAQCATDEDFTLGLNSQTTSHLSVKLENLAGDTLYYCHVAATNQHGQSVWSPTLQARTSLYSQPPTNLKTTVVSNSEISYSWDAVPGAQYYILQYTTDISFIKDVTTIRVDATSGSIKGLQPYTGYFFRSEAVTSSFDQTHAAFSDAAFARTKK